MMAVIDEVLHYLTIDGARFRYDGALRDVARMWMWTQL
jgi:hypothetical protein